MGRILTFSYLYDIINTIVVEMVKNSTIVSIIHFFKSY